MARARHTGLAGALMTAQVVEADAQIAVADVLGEDACDEDRVPKNAVACATAFSPYVGVLTFHFWWS